MRKHNVRFAERFSRTKDDRTNFPQSMAHSITNNKAFQLSANGLLGGLFKRAWIRHGEG